MSNPPLPGQNNLQVIALKPCPDQGSECLQVVSVRVSVSGWLLTALVWKGAMVVSLYSWSRDDTPVPGLSGHVDCELFSPLRSEACKVDLQLATPPTLSSKPEAGWILSLRFSVKPKKGRVTQDVRF